MYYVERKKEIIPWKAILGMTKYYDHILLYIIKSNLLSRDHIIAIIKGWIFDGNLNYAIASNEENLIWCAGHGKPGIYFVVFYEQIQISIKEKIVKTKTKT